MAAVVVSDHYGNCDRSIAAPFKLVGDLHEGPSSNGTPLSSNGAADVDANDAEVAAGLMMIMTGVAADDAGGRRALVLARRTSLPPAVAGLRRAMNRRSRARLAPCHQDPKTAPRT